MASSGYLVPKSQDLEQEKLWVETWKRLDRFLPDLRRELNLDEPSSDARSTESHIAPATVTKATTS
jgi:brefeldin A-resistance guanine nucleotide exchange factor 1